jgi:hypothetical protein
MAMADTSASLNSNLLQLQASRKDSTKLMSKINSSHDKCRLKTPEAYLTEKQCQKLGGLYQQAAHSAAMEAKAAGLASQAINMLLTGGGKKRKSEGGGGRGRRKRIAEVEHPVNIGTTVAALHRVVEGPQWVLGSVSGYDAGTSTVRRSLSVPFALCSS